MPNSPERDPNAKTFLHVEPSHREKAKWVQAANGAPLEAWVIQQLNSAAEAHEKRKGKKQ